MDEQRTLHDLPILRFLPPDVRKLVVDSFERVTLPFGSPIVREGEEADAFYVLSSGRADDSFKRGLGDRFRTESRSLDLLLDPGRESESSLAPGLAVLHRRSERLIPLVGELKSLEATGRLSQPVAAIAPSYVHMHANRLLRSGHRNHEIVLYDFLGRLYETQAARARSGKAPAQSSGKVSV